MKDLTTYYNNKNILFKDINQITPKEIGSRKKMDIFCATDIDLSYYAIFIVSSKSRFIKKNSEDLIALLEKLKDFKGHNFKYKELIITSPLCSKAKKILEENAWRVRIDFM